MNWAIPPRMPVPIPPAQQPPQPQQQQPPERRRADNDPRQVIADRDGDSAA